MWGRVWVRGERQVARLLKLVLSVWFLSLLVHHHLWKEEGEGGSSQAIPGVQVTHTSWPG